MAVIAYWMLFTAFMSYDDEGYVLISLRNYSAFGGLYSKVYSQYGPFFYLLHDLGHRILGYEFTNTNGRLITLVFWVGATIACSHLVWQQTRTLSLALFTAGLTFFHLWFMASEPIHPGGLIAFLVAIGACWGASQIERRALRPLAIMSALIGTGLLLTKINVGIFFLTSAGVWFLVNLSETSRVRPLAILSAILLIFLPFVLMQREITENWVQMYASLSAVASVTMVIATWIDRQPATLGRHAIWATATLLLASAAILTAVCLRGTSISALLEGVVLGPLRHPGVYRYPPFWIPGAALAGAVSLGLGIVVLKFRPPQLIGLIVTIRLLLAAEFSLASLEMLPVTSHSSTMSFLVPFAWVFCVRIAPNEGRRPNVAPWVGLLLVLQYLHAYPVAGSQIAWGTFLIVPVMALGLDDTRRLLAHHNQFLTSTAISILFGGIAIFAGARLGEIGFHRYFGSKPLQLRGAEDIRLPEEYASRLRLFSLNAAAQGDMLFSLPGMYSFNLWTKLPTPTLVNTTHWFSLLSLEQQEAIVSSLQASKRPVLIIHDGLIEFLTDSKFLVKGPLVDYLRENFSRLFRLEKYEFLIRKGREIIPLDTAELLQLRAPGPGMSPNRLEIIAVVPPDSKVASIELATLDDNPRTLKRWSRTTGKLVSTPINLGGAAVNTESDNAWDVPLPRLVRLDLSLASPLNFVRRYTAVYLRDADGAVIAEARFIE